MLGRKNFDFNALPRLATANEADVPAVDPREIADLFPSREFDYDRFDAVHDKDFYYFENLGNSIVFCDIGANIGQTVVTLRHLKSRAKLHSFEINPVCWPVLERRSAGYLGEFSIHPYGLGDKDGTFDLFIPVNGKAAISTLGTLEFKSLQTPILARVLERTAPGADWRVVKTRVEVRTFDSLGIQPDFVKIDVEGFEAGVLRGMLETIARKPPVFLIENTNPEAVEAVLVPLGYLPCNWNWQAKSVQLTNGRHVNANSLYIHSSEILAMLRGKGKQDTILDTGDGVFENQYAGSLAGPVTDKYLNEAFRVFFGVDPTPEQVSMHSKFDKSKIAMRNRFMRFIIEQGKK